MTDANITLAQAAAAFDFGAPTAEISPISSGHVNSTFRVQTCTGRRFILQRINSIAFHHPEEVMDNALRITAHLRSELRREGGDWERGALRFLPTRDGTPFYTDDQGEVWRVYPFVEGTVCLQRAETPELFSAAGRAFGRFQRMLCQFPAATLYETIPHFHDTPDRLRLLRQALEADPVGRRSGVQREAEFILARAADCSVTMDAMAEGRLPLRVTHNDTKLNNVLLDEVTGEGVCVIDLDTVMPGLSVNDFGDAIRFGANHCTEDEQDLSLVSFDLPLYTAFTQGFLSGTDGSLTDAELDYLPWGARLMTLECGIRFLTDFLEGDRYFHCDRPEHNLDRCRTQLKLVADMETLWQPMCEIVDTCRKTLPSL